MNKKLLTPRPGLRVADPERLDFLPEGGRVIDLNGAYLQHWARRIADGDVTVGDIQGEQSVDPKTKSRPRHNQSSMES